VDHPLRELSQLIVRHSEHGERQLRTFGHVQVSFGSEKKKSDEPAHRTYEPVFALVVQGEKQLFLGDRVFTCKRGSFLVVSVDLPVTYRISMATSKEPYIALAMTLRPAEVASLLLEAAASLPAEVESQSPPPAVGIGVSDASTELLEAVVRLVRLVDHPRDVPVLAPVIEREILWRLLCSEQGHRLRQIGLADSRLSQVGRAIRFLREHYNESLRIEDLARRSAMSVTSFHRHFRAVALMSPLQYQKRIRLQEARTRLLSGAADVTSVGLAVGYDSASQFSREYKRAYGAPPGQDARSLRGHTATADSK